MRSKEELLSIAETVAGEIISDWIHDWGSWDCIAEDEQLTDEEYEWIQENIKVNVEVKFN
jgi:hypothetical protein